jgi:hypothetical protein
LLFSRASFCETGGSLEYLLRYLYCALRVTRERDRHELRAHLDVVVRSNSQADDEESELYKVELERDDAALAARSDRAAHDAQQEDRAHPRQKTEEASRESDGDEIEQTTD